MLSFIRVLFANGARTNNRARGLRFEAVESRSMFSVSTFAGVSVGEADLSDTAALHAEQQDEAQAFADVTDAVDSAHDHDGGFIHGVAEFFKRFEKDEDGDGEPDRFVPPATEDAEGEEENDGDADPVDDPEIVEE